MAQLPQELIVETLLRLPVKSLLRFRCLSNSMCATIDAPDFINSHLSMSSLNLNLHKLIFSDSLASKFHVCDVNLDLEQNILLLEKQQFPFLWKEDHHCNCKGLVLLSPSQYQFKFILWNPSTRRFMDLPDFPFLVDFRYYRLIASGLGYDDSVDDYKVVIMIHVINQKLEFEIQVWIYRLKSNIWTRAQNFPYLQYIANPKIGYFTTDGSLNWLYRLNYETSEPKSEIVSFDMSKETFSIVPQPVSSVGKASRELYVLEGCLCIFFYGAEHADLYIRNNDGIDMFTWTKLFSVTAVETLSFSIHTSRSMNLLLYSKSGDKILLEINGCLVLYDLKEKTFAKVAVDIDIGWSFLIMCPESLVSVGGGA